MTFNLMFTYSSIAFTTILVTIYFHKTAFNNVRIKLYKSLIILTLLFTISEMIPVYLSNNAKYLTLEMITWKIHWGFGFIWLLLFFMYNLVLCKKLETKSIFETIMHNTFTKIITGVFILLYVIYLFLKYKTLKVNNSYSFVYGNTTYIVMGFSIIMLAFMGYLIFKYKKNYNRNE